MVNIYVAFEIKLWLFIVCKDFASGNSVFAAAQLTKNADSDELKYSDCGNGFDSPGNCLSSDGSVFDKNVRWRLFEFICAFDNKKKDIGNPCKGPADNLDEGTLAAKKIFHKFY